MGVRNDGSRHGPPRIDVKLPLRAIKPVGGDDDEIFGDLEVLALGLRCSP
jgi:hypothetical protein